MEIGSLLSAHLTTNPQTHSEKPKGSPPVGSSRNTMAGLDMHTENTRKNTPPTAYSTTPPDSTPSNLHISPPNGVSPTPKSVAFELLFSESSQHRARLPMRVQIFPHDTTDSIVTTVKNFYGLYAGPGGAKGVSFEDVQGNTLIARYENLHNNMIVYVRVIEEPAQSNEYFGAHSYHSGSPLMAPGYFPSHAQSMPPPQPAQALNYGQPDSRPHSRTSRKRSQSPNSGRGRRSASASANPPPLKKNRSRSGFKSRGSSAHGSFADYSDGMNGYSSGDGAGSVSSKTRSEHIGNTEISLDNIVEGGRRKRAKFESSELPLFAPPQMPAATSNSSVSPARRMDQRSSYPFSNPSHNPFSHPQPLHSPQSYSNNGFGQPGIYTTPANNGRRTRGGVGYPQGRQSIGATPGSGILPTPDPTVGSCMSEEDKDVALQLMRLGDMSNISHGRTSASTLDDTFSGRADAASSTGATSDADSDSELELPPARRQKREPSPILPPGAIKRFRQHLDDILPSQDSTEPSGDEGDFGDDETFRPSGYEHKMDLDKAKLSKSKSLPMNGNKSRSAITGLKSKTGTKVIKPKKSSGVTAANKISPASVGSQSRKPSNASLLNHAPLGDDEEDLSSKPRCQRCRKSKKGCDRQRPCQRCKDAGLGADQCISEDEGNGRKGRYGRHMGVPVKKDELVTTEPSILPPSILAMGPSSPDKSKKRKR